MTDRLRYETPTGRRRRPFRAREDDRSGQSDRARNGNREGGVPGAPSDHDVEEDPHSGLEVEQDDPQVKIEHPFDPEKIKVRTTPLLVESLVARIKHEEIDLAPDFQRSLVWDEKRKCRLIESLLLRIPIPVFYVAADEKENWAVVDGIQRISTIYEYLTDRFPLGQLEYLDQLDGQTYSTLPRPMQRRINETQFVVNVIEPGTPEDVMFNIFRRINTGGMALNGQEIRHALHIGPVRAYLKKLAGTQDFLEATRRSVKSDRMADRECVLRFLAFRLDTWEEYNTSDLDGYLGRAMTKINAMSEDARERIARDFEKAMRAASRIFGDDAFRKRYDIEDPRRRPISKALFEAWSVQLARCSAVEIDELIDKREEIRKRFISLMNEDGDFDRAISYGTGTPRRVKKRFGAIADLIAEVLAC